jgi:hypothetical protein
MCLILAMVLIPLPQFWQAAETYCHLGGARRPVSQAPAQCAQRFEQYKESGLKGR